MPPLALSDDQLTAIMQAAAPLPFDRRAAFLEEIAAQLRGRGREASNPPCLVTLVYLDLERSIQQNA
jgi:hypothetical protein